MGLIQREHLSPTGERSIAQLDLPGFSKRRIRLEYIIFALRVYRGHWTIPKIMANVMAAFLKAYPRVYSFYLRARNNIPFFTNLANRYGGEHAFGKKAGTVGTREDVIRD